MSLPENVAENLRASSSRTSSKQTIFLMASQKAENNRIIARQKIPDGKRNVLTEKLLNDIGAKVETLPGKSL
jgi:hypothetical protein